MVYASIARAILQGNIHRLLLLQNCAVKMVVERSLVSAQQLTS
jgi:hypothetical protein